MAYKNIYFLLTGLWSAITLLNLAELGSSFGLCLLHGFPHPRIQAKKYPLLECVILVMEGRHVRNGNHVMLFKISTGNYHYYFCSIG